MSTVDLLADGLAAGLEAALSAGVHLLDPETRKETIRELVAREVAKWSTIGDGRTSAQRSEEVTARHLVEPSPGSARPDGRAAFEAYRAHRGGKNHDGTPTPTWDELGPGVREGWEAAARAVAARAGR